MVNGVCRKAVTNSVLEPLDRTMYKERNTSVTNKEAGRLMHSVGSTLRFDRLYIPKKVDASAVAKGTGEV